MRDSLFMDEIQLMVRMMKAGAPWDAVRSMFPGVDPAALDEKFKETLTARASAPDEAPSPESIQAAAEDKALAEMLAADEAAKKAAPKKVKAGNPLE
jgi:hypothetical protein